VSSVAGHTVPLLEFDPSPVAVIEPSRVFRRKAVPARAVVCFFSEVIADVCVGADVVQVIPSEHVPHPIHVVEIDGEPLAVFNPGMGAPMAAMALECAIAIGCRAFVACGSAGVLDPGFDVGHVVVPTAAVRDEGTSHHYLPPARTVAPGAAALAAVDAVLTEAGIPHDRALTWTTDALYRETRAKVERRRAEGCLTVEMEAAAFFAVARFRGVEFAQLLYAGDDLSAASWDHRAFTTNRSARERLFRLAAAAVTRIPV
jgi:uridine phosphorylase